MIVGMALKEVFKDLTINGVSVQFHFGDQKEFNYWVVSKMKAKKQKYPLIWYVITSPEPHGNGKLRVNAQLILFQGNERTQQLNDQRYTYTYLTYLEPLYELVFKTLKDNKFIVLLDAYNGLNYKDEPNYGIDLATKEVPTDGVNVVDAKIIPLKMDINPKCIITTQQDNGGGYNGGGDNGGGNDGSFIYVSLTSNFFNPFSLPSNIINYPNIKDYTSEEILAFWLDNENYAVSTSSPSNRLISDDNTFKVGALLKIAQGLPAFDGKYLGNQSGMSGTIVGGTYRLNPARMSPYIPDYNPVYNQNPNLPPLAFQKNTDTINTVLFTVVGGVITEVEPFPVTGFAYE